MINPAVENLVELWNALELELLIPAKLPRSQLKLFAEIDDSPGHLDAFCESMPITIARFRTEKEKEILRWIKQRNDKTPRQNANEAFVRKTEEAFTRDVQKIHGVLIKRFTVASSKYGDDPFHDYNVEKMANCHMGAYTQSRSPELHTDCKGCDGISAVYIARLGALPFEVIDGKRLARATTTETQLIAEACDPDNKMAEEKTKILRNKGILRKVGLGELTLMVAGKKSTYHCSAPKFQGAYFSAFLRTFAYLRPTPN